MTDYQIVFEYKYPLSDLLHWIPLLIFPFIGFGLVYYLKRTMNYSLPRQIGLFIGYLFGGFATIALIIALVQLPAKISRERKLNNMIESKNYTIVEGEIENFSPQPENTTKTESFSVKGVQFEYSDYVMINGFHQTSRMNGPIRENGQKVRISYFTIDNVNLIQKIEIKK